MTVVGALAGACALVLWLGPAVGLGSSVEPPSNDNFLFAVNLNARGQPLTPINTLRSKIDTTHAGLQGNLLSPCGVQFVCANGPSEPNSCNGVSYGKTAWYDFYPDHDGQVEIRTSGLPNVIALYTYDPSTLAPTEIQCASGSKYDSNELVANVRSGVAYTFQIGGRGSAGGKLGMQFNYAYRTDLAVAPFFTDALVRIFSAEPKQAQILQLRFVGLVRGETASYACAGCGGGLLRLGKRRGNTVVLSSRPNPTITSQTRMIIAATAPAQVGRFKLYTYDPIGQDLRVLSSGCLAPGQSMVTPSDAKHLPLLKPIPCPATLVNPIGAEYVFWRSTSAGLSEARYTGRNWTAAVQLNVGRIASPPAVTVHANGEQDVFWRGPEGQLWEAWYNGNWNGPIPLGGNLASAPTAGVDSAGDEYVFWKGQGGGLIEKRYADQGWSLPFSVNVGELGSGPAVAVHPGGEVDVFWKGLNGQLTEAWCTNDCGYRGIWRQTTFPGAGTLGSTPAVATDAAGNEYVFWEGTDHGLWGQSYGARGWEPAAPLNGGLLGSPPTVAVHADGQQDVFWEGRDGRLWETWGTAHHWNGPIHLHAYPGSQPAAGLDASGKSAGSP